MDTPAITQAQAQQLVAQHSSPLYIYDWTTPGEVRFVTSWDNTNTDTQQLVAILS
jgi:hypothetical protein